MKKKRILAVVAIIALLITGVSFTALAHSGRTDSAGGHRDNNNVSGLGYYHYHHGYPAHLHPGGVCPYTSTSTPSTPSTTTPTTPAAPAVPTKTLTASYPGISIYLNSALITPKDANGTVVAPFIVNGTTYLPVRAIANALGLTVDWNGATYTISLTGSVNNAGAVNNTDSEEFAFFRNNAAIVLDDDDSYYHHFDCPTWQNQSYQILNTNLAEAMDYSPCPDCWYSGLI